ncbi:MAG: formate dehydrogenase accessory protein FdhE [Coriobacteriia bacterium]|nr:formate dehydrogenase accessory protein FdhE [Coriobacteriia bacterium]
MDLQVHLKALDHYQDFIPEDQITVLRELWTLQDEVAPSVIWEPLDTKTVNEFTQKEVPLFSVLAEDAVKLDWFKDAFARIAAFVFNQTKQAMPEALQNALASLEQEDLSKLLIDQDVLFSKLKDTLSDDQGAIQAMALSLLLTTQAVSRAYARDMKEIDFKAFTFHHSNHCPVCGNAPSLAIIDAPIAYEGGKRFLYCSQCETVWHYPRLACAHCKQTDPEKLQYFYLPEDQAYRLHGCAHCGNVMPTLAREFVDHKLYSPRVEEVVCTLKTQAFEDQKKISEFLQ